MLKRYLAVLLSILLLLGMLPAAALAEPEPTPCLCFFEANTDWDEENQCEVYSLRSDPPHRGGIGAFPGWDVCGQFWLQTGEDSYTLVDPDTLNTDELGDCFSITPLKDGFVRLRFEGFGEGAVFYADIRMGFHSALPEIGFYSDAIFTDEGHTALKTDETDWTDAFLVDLAFSGGTNTQTVYLIARDNAEIEDTPWNQRADDVEIKAVQGLANVFAVTLTDPVEDRLDLGFRSRHSGDAGYQDDGFSLAIRDARSKALAFQWANWKEDEEKYEYEGLERRVDAGLGDERCIRLVWSDGEHTNALTDEELADVTIGGLDYEIDENVHDVFRIWFRALRGEIRCGDTRILTEGFLPDIGFYTQAVAADASDSDYFEKLVPVWDFIGENDTVWAVIRGEGAFFSGVENRSGNTVEINDGAAIPESGLRAVKVRLTEVGDDRLELAFRGQWDADAAHSFGGAGQEETREIALNDVRPGLCFRNAWWDDGLYDGAGGMRIGEGANTVLRDDVGGRPSVQVCLRASDGTVTPVDDLDKVTVSGCVEKFLRDDGLIELFFARTGDGAVSYNDGETEYSFRCVASLPQVGFCSALPEDGTDAAFENVLITSWILDGTNDSVYLVARDGAKITEVWSECGSRFDESKFDLSAGDVTSVQVRLLALDGDNIVLRVKGVDRDGREFDEGWGHRMELHTEDRSPGLCWRWVQWEGGPHIDPNEAPSSCLIESVGSEPVIAVYLRDAEGNLSGLIDPADLTVEGAAYNRNTKEEEKDWIPEEEKPYLKLIFTDFGEATLTYRVGDDTYTRTLMSELPGDGWFNDPNAPDSTEAFLRSWIYGGKDGTNTVYYVLRGGDEAFLTAIESDCDADLSFGNIPEGGAKYVSVTLNAPYTGDKISVRISGQWGRDNAFANESRSIDFEDHSEGLCFRWVHWRDEGDDRVPYVSEGDATERSLNASLGDEPVLAVYLRDADGALSDPIAPTDLTVTGAAYNRNTKEDEADWIPDEEKDYLKLIFTATGEATLSYQVDEDTRYTLPLHCELPEIGFYSTPEATEEAFLRDWVRYPGDGNSIYLVARDTSFRLTNVIHTDGAPVDIALRDDGAYATLTVDDMSAGKLKVDFDYWFVWTDGGGEEQHKDRHDSREIRLYDLTDVWTNLWIEADGDDFVVAKGGSATIAVRAGADVPEGAEKNDLHYQWYRLSVPEIDQREPWEKDVIDGETGDRLVLKGLTRGGEYWCEVTDDFGNSDGCWFRVNTDTGLEIHAVSPEAATRSEEVHFEAGKSVTLKAEAAVGEGHTFRYQWYRTHRDQWPERLTNETGAELTVTYGDQFQCWAIDEEDNIVFSSFDVYADNTFDAWADQMYVFLRPGEDAALKVTASCDTGDLHYQWFKEDPDGWRDPEMIVSAASNTYPVQSVPSGYSPYFCRVSDDYGNEVDVGVYITANDGLMFRVKNEAELQTALSQTGADTYVSVIYIEDSFEITKDCRMLYDPAHFSNYQYTFMIVNRGVTLTVADGGMIGCSIHESYDRDTQQASGEPWDQFWNFGTIIVKDGGELAEAFRENEGQITVKDGGRCTIPQMNTGRITVEEGGWLGTTMGEIAINDGEINVAEGAMLEARFGGRIFNRCNLTLDGDFYVGCISHPDWDGGPNELHVWFENYGMMNGRGSIYLRNLGCTHSEMDEAIEHVMEMLGQEKRFDDWNDISIFRYLNAVNEEELMAAFPGDRRVNGEEVPGDMDTVVVIDGDIDFDKIIPATVTLNGAIHTMGRIRIPAGSALNLSAGAAVQAGIENEGTVTVAGGATLSTTQGGSIENRGTLTVNEGAVLISTMGGVVVNDGTMALNGTFSCGCVRYPDEHNESHDHFWFENRAGAIGGSGTVLLRDLGFGNDPIADKDGIKTAAEDALGNSDITVQWYTFYLTAASDPAPDAQSGVIDLAPGETATLTVEATGGEGLTYQWYRTHYGRYNDPLPGETGTTLTVGESDEYFCHATDSYGLTEEAGFEVEVRNEFDILREPMYPIYVNAGDVSAQNPLVLTVTAKATDTDHIHYQWYKNVNPYYGDYSGKMENETGDALTLTEATESAEYYVDVDDGYNNYYTAGFRVIVTEKKVLRVGNQAELTAALNRNEPVAAIYITDSFTVTEDSVVLFDEAHHANYSNTLLAIQPGVTLTVESRFGCAWFSYNWNRMHDSYAEPTGTLYNSGTIIVNEGGFVETAFRLNSGTITVNSGGTCITPSYNFGDVTVKSGGQFLTSQNSDMRNISYVEVEEGGFMEARFGSTIINEGQIRLDGHFRVNCFVYPDAENPDPTLHVWFDNCGQISGSGEIRVAGSSADDLDEAIERVMEMLGQERRFDDWDDIAIYRELTAATVEELHAALPGNRWVNGEEVTGDMDTVVWLEQFDEDDNLIPVSVDLSDALHTMGRIIVNDQTKLTLLSGSSLQAGIENRGEILVKSGATLSTTQGGSIENRGTLTVNEGAVLISTMGGVVVNDGTMTLNGTFSCGCIRYPDENGESHDHFWFENHAGAIGGIGTVLLRDLGFGNDPIADKDGIKTAAEDALGNSDITVQWYTFYLTAASTPEPDGQSRTIGLQPGETAALSVTATGGEDLTYRWYRFDAGLSGETGTTLAVTKSGDYVCRATDCYGLVEEAWFTVEVYNELDAYADQMYVFLRPGEDAALKVTASCKQGDLHYQWFKEDPDGWRDPEMIVSAASNTYPVQSVPSGYSPYFCRVSDDYGNEIDVGVYITANDGLMFHVKNEAELQTALSQTGANTCVSVIYIEDSFEITKDCRMLYDPAHFSNYQYTFMIVNRGVTLTVADGGMIGCSIHESYDWDTQQASGEPWDQFWNFGTIIVKDGGELAEAFRENEGEITVKDGGRCTIPQLNGGRITVEAGGWLGTTMGEMAENYGEIVIEAGAMLEARFGGQIKNGWNLTLNGDFYVGCAKYSDTENGPKVLHVWFENEGNVSGCGSIWLRCLDCSNEEMDEAIERVMGMLGQDKRFDNWDDVSIYRELSAATVEELRALLPGDRVVAGERVDGDMDTVVWLEQYDEDGNLLPVSVDLFGTLDTMARIVVNKDALLTLKAGASLEAGLEIRGAVVVESGATLSTTQGGNIENHGTLTVNEGAALISTMGGVVINDGTMTLDGLFRCGCAGNDCWFDLRGGELLGSGTIVLFEDNPGEAPVESMTPLVLGLRERIAGGNSIEVGSETLIAFTDSDGKCCACIYIPEADENDRIIAARYDENWRFLSLEYKPLASGVNDVSIEREGAAHVRFFALDDYAPFCPAADIPEQPQS